MTKNPKVRVRFAPSPTGWLHIGGARTALFNYLFARHNGGKFLLRIEDTDKERSNDEMTGAILRSLQWLGLNWDEPVVYQSKGIEEQVALCDRLVAEGKAYRCFCSPEMLEKKREEGHADRKYLYDGTCRALSDEQIQSNLEGMIPYTIRFKTAPGITSFNDHVRGPVSVDNKEIGDFIVLRSDRTPIYQVAVVSDDHAMGISHVIRGDDHLSNTPKQILIYEACGWPLPEFAHVPMILGPDKKRLSKRHGAASVEEYTIMGYLPEALNNFLALMGWSPGEDREIMSQEEMEFLFSLDRITKNPAVFDQVKLNWLNSQYIQNMKTEELLRAVTPNLISRGLLSESELEERGDEMMRIAALLQPRLKLLTEFIDQAAYFLKAPAAYDEKAVKKHWHKDGSGERLQRIYHALREIDDWTESAIERVIRSMAEQEEVGAGKMIHPIRLAITGLSSSPGLFEVMVILGKAAVIERIEAALLWLEINRD